MTDSLAALKRCHEAIYRLHPTSTCEKFDEDVRGGLSAGGFRDGGRSAETPIPELDKADRNALALKREYQNSIYAAAVALERALAIETGRQPELHLSTRELKELHDKLSRAAVEEVSSRAGECANCKRPVERTPDDRLIRGRCKPCYEYAQNHDGADRPKSLWEQDIERELAR